MLIGTCLWEVTGSPKDSLHGCRPVSGSMHYIPSLEDHESVLAAT